MPRSRTYADVAIGRRTARGQRRGTTAGNPPAKTAAAAVESGLETGSHLPSTWRNSTRSPSACGDRRDSPNSPFRCPATSHGLLAWARDGQSGRFQNRSGATASALAQILPLLLLTLMVELRRTALHRALSRPLFGVFFFVFGVIETVLVLSIDGMLYPFQWGDLLSALAIFTLLTMIS